MLCCESTENVVDLIWSFLDNICLVPAVLMLDRKVEQRRLLLLYSLLTFQSKQHISRCAETAWNLLHRKCKLSGG